MTLPTQLLVRVASRLHNIWHSRAHIVARDGCHWLRRLQDRLEALQVGMDRLTKARGHRLELVLPSLQQEILDQCEGLRLAMIVARDSMTCSAPAVPAIAAFMEEIQQIEEDFIQFSIDWKKKIVIATTEPITLRDVYLGPFAIHFCWERLLHQADVACFDVVALEPHPPVANGRVTHPHVKDRSLCAGDAAVPIRKALDQGHLADAFCLISGVLHHYNPDSPHVHLDDWEGTECHDCGRNIGDDDRWCCESCDRDFCDDCIGSCAICDTNRCHGCLARCDGCEEPCCAHCLQSCAGSGGEYCRRCRAVCTQCGATVAKDDRDEAGLCRSCQPSSEQPDRPEKPHATDVEPVLPSSL
jgi:hypothetical protein